MGTLTLGLRNGRLALLTPAQLALGVVLLTSLLHLLVMGRFAFGVDEAHYALYGQRLDWSYFDHPPMVGWLQALVVHISQGEFALRLWAVVLGGVASWLLYRLTRTLFPEHSPWAAAIAVALLHSAIIFQLTSLALVPEGPLLVAALFAALMLYRALHEGRMVHWLGLGIAFGLAGLSKYTAVTLVITTVVLVVWERRWRLLRSPGPWLAVVVALLLITPVLYWNLHHDWLSFRYQLGHGAPDRHWSIARFARAEVIQIFAYAPLLVVGGVWAALSGLRQTAHAGVRFSLALALPVLLLMGWGAGLQESLPHWTLLGWVALLPLLALKLLEGWHKRWLRGLAWSSALYSLLLIVVLHSQFLRPWLPFEPYRHPFGDLYGWREAAQRAQQLAEEQGEQTLFVGNWSLASRIAWYARPMRVVVADARVDQFDLWYGAPQPGDHGILIVPETYEGRPEVSGEAHFSACRLVSDEPHLLNDTPVHRFKFYACSGYRE